MGCRAVVAENLRLLTGGPPGWAFTAPTAGDVQIAVGQSGVMDVSAVAPRQRPRRPAGRVEVDVSRKRLENHPARSTLTDEIDPGEPCRNGYRR
jgi:hypothetical protein